MKTLLDGIFTYALMAFLPLLVALILATSDASGATPGDEAPQSNVLVVFHFQEALNTPFGVIVFKKHGLGAEHIRNYMWNGFAIVSFPADSGLNPAWKQANGM